MRPSIAHSDAIESQRTVDVVIPVFRPGNWLRSCVDSVLATTGVRPCIYLVDDDPTAPLDDSVVGPGSSAAEVIRMARNSGFAAACNAGIRSGASEYVLVLNQDARIQPDYLSRLVARFDADPALAAAGGKLLHQETPESLPSGFIDTCGIAMRRGRRPVDLRQGDRDDGGPGEWHEVFGVCAAAALYRRSALIDVSEEGQVFPELFVMHKEDVDLGWRLRSAGFRAGVDTAAIGYHARGIRRAADVTGSGISPWFTRARRLLEQERHKSARVRAITWRNQVLLLILNERQEDFIRSSLDLLVYQALQTGISFVFNPVTTFLSRVEIFGVLPRAFALRRRRRALSGASLREWLP